ncbi:hypothetical protein [Pseudoalteromonas sp. DY56-GL79]|uniref:hypothetical protein n=1 Tax=Pseudoalteromonas sp. DY56-GL79 TaxID=2967131 RepID=UPI00352BC52D
MAVSTAILLTLFLGPILYIVKTLFMAPITTSAEYHYASRKIKASHFIDSTVMYSLQIASITLFATWGFIFGLWTLLVPIFWGVGFYFVSYFLKSGKLDDFITSESFGTLHQFISNGGNQRLLAILASIVTLVALAGPAMFEIKYVSEIVSVGLTGTDSSSIILMIAFLGVSGTYMLKGGFSNVVWTDRIQLLLGYGLFNLFMALIVRHFSELFSTPAVITLMLMTVFSSVIAFKKTSFDSKQNLKDYLSLMSVWFVAFMYLAILLEVLLKFGVTASSIGEYFTEALSSNFSFLSLLSLFVANAFYQLVDVGQWQRLLSVEVSEGNLDETKARLRQALKVIALYSPLTWAIFVIFGVFLKYALSEVDPYVMINQLSNLVFSNKLFQPLTILLAGLLVLSLTSVMYSTVDSLFASSSFTVANDLFKLEKKSTGSLVTKHVVISFFTVVTIFLQLLIYFTLSELAGNRFDAVLYTCWAFQLALLPLVLATIYGKARSQIAGVLSIAIGCFAAVSPLIFGSPYDVYEYSPWLTVFSSSIVYGLWNRS